MKKYFLICSLLFTSIANAQEYSMENIEFADLTPEEKEANSTKNKNIVSMKVVTSSDNLVVRPGEHFMIGVIAQTKNGEEIRTPLAGGNNDLNFNYNILGYGAFRMDSEKRKIYVHNLTKLKEDKIEIIVKDRFHEEFKESVFMTLDYSGDKSCYDFKGEDGKYGTQPAERESCRELRGFDGSKGERGGDAPDLTIYVQKTKHTVTDESILRIFIIGSDGKTKSYIMNEGSNLMIKATGGKGGNGGTGGKGSNITSACSYNLSRGISGNGGDAGDGGNGANVRLILNDASIDHESLFTFVLRGGQGGTGGKGNTNGAKGNYGSDGSVRVEIDPELLVDFQN